MDFSGLVGLLASQEGTAPWS